MSDTRVRNAARLLVRYCIAARPGEEVGVSGTSLAEPLIEAVCAELYRAGAFPAVRMAPVRLQELLFQEGRPAHFRTVGATQLDYARRVAATIGIQSEANTRALSGADPARQAALAKAMLPVRRLLLRARWVVTLFPTAAYAQDAEMSLAAFEDFAYGAMCADEPDPEAAWLEVRRRQARLIRRLRGADAIRIVGPDTDLRLSVKGRTFINSDGRRNMPSGEVFTGPVEDSAEGRIRFDYPVRVSGCEVSGVRLVFRAGRVVEASAEKNEAFLLRMLDADPGARRLGELGIGTNRRIDRFIGNILFDEKIGGTIHLALGRSYPETGGRNRSAIHWDLIKDLRRGGALQVNGRAFQRDGFFVGEGAGRPRAGAAGAKRRGGGGEGL